MDKRAVPDDYVVGDVGRVGPVGIHRMESLVVETATGFGILRVYPNYASGWLLRPEYTKRAVMDYAAAIGIEEELWRSYYLTSLAGRPKPSPR